MKAEIVNQRHFVTYFKVTWDIKTWYMKLEFLFPISKQHKENKVPLNVGYERINMKE